jgi:myosin heavy subunit
LVYYVVGIFRLLDDVCRTVHAESSQVIDQKFMAKLIKEPIAKHPHIILVPEVTTSFTIQHYAGKVTYTVEDFCFKVSHPPQFLL